MTQTKENSASHEYIQNSETRNSAPLAFMDSGAMQTVSHDGTGNTPKKYHHSSNTPQTKGRWNKVENRLTSKNLTNQTSSQSTSPADLQNTYRYQKDLEWETIDKDQVCDNMKYERRQEEAARDIAQYDFIEDEEDVRSKCFSSQERESSINLNIRSVLMWCRS